MLPVIQGRRSEGLSGRESPEVTVRSQDSRDLVLPVWVPQKGTLINVLVTSTESAVAAVISVPLHNIMNHTHLLRRGQPVRRNPLETVGWGKIEIRDEEQGCELDEEVQVEGGFRCVQDTLSTTPHKCGQSIRCTQTVRRLDDEGVEIANV
ncbi:hypothetical protein BKA70DRAFT_1234137 [Coprinopsis sp. MPI-PUGE-AT-0042]|nr:hypothetical protein BKA70DRAFT_1234137 [Coprinopsis sp. MPI-PUGE-AT-0042]